MKTILFSPVRQDAETLELVLRSHAQLSGVYDRWYYDDNDSPESRDLLAHSARIGNVRILPAIDADSRPQYDVSGSTHQWTHGLVSRISKIRNYAVAEFLKSDADALLVVDADLVLHRATVEHLTRLDQAIASEVFWTSWNRGEIQMPNVWDMHPYAFDSFESITRLREKGQFTVGGLGACTLIRRSVFEAGVNYSPIPNLNVWGEDRWFCTRAAASGYRLKADTCFPPFHVYRREQLDEAVAWFEEGSTPEYFREMWLTDQWKGAIEGQFTPSQVNPEAKKRIAICFPGELFSGKWMMGALELVMYLGQHYEIVPRGCYSSDPSVTRQALTKEVLSGTRCDYVLWLDDDNTLSPAQAQVLIGTLDACPQFDAICGWCNILRDSDDATQEPKTSCGMFDEDGMCVHFTSADLARNALVKTDWSGFPAVLMRFELLETLGPKAFVPIVADVEYGRFGEDVSFWKRAAAAGATLVCDPRIKVPHWKLRDANSLAVPRIDRDLFERMQP